MILLRRLYLNHHQILIYRTLLFPTPLLVEFKFPPMKCNKMPLFRSSCAEVLCERAFLNTFVKFTGKKCGRVSILIKLTASILLERGSGKSVISGILQKMLGIVLLTITSSWPLLYFKIFLFMKNFESRTHFFRENLPVQKQSPRDTL